jgi:hypothetical protein
MTKTISAHSQPVQGACWHGAPLLLWYEFYRRQVPSKDAGDIKTLKELGEE